jgi:putative SOS response-associated peptidase YedK
MCGRYTLTSQEGLVDDFEAALDPDAPKNPWFKARFNVAPTQDAPIVRLRDGVRVIEMMRWGLVPFWGGKQGAKPPLMINARLESIESKRVFKDALERRRCLVPADGFFEWKKDGKHKQPMWVHPEDHARFAFAGLWAKAKTDAGELHSYTIITGPPNPLVAPIHDRMPVVLDRRAWAAWLDPETAPHAARELLVVPPVTGWSAEPVSPWVNSADHDDPTCVELADAPAQSSLF